MGVKVVCDSTLDLPDDYIRRHDIAMVPLSVRFGEEFFKERVEISIPEFWRRLIGSDVLPSTTQPSPQDFKEVFERLGRGGNSIICITLSSKLSGTYQAATLAARDLADLDIAVVDSKSASIGTGLIAQAAVEALESGRGKDGALSVIQKVIERQKIFFIVDTLEYLQKGGRIGKAQAFLGTILNFKPILGLEDGVVVPVERERGRKKAIRRLVDLVEADVKGEEIFCAVASSATEDMEGMREQLSEELRARLGIGEIPKYHVGAVIGAHAGPVVACFYYKKKDVV
ncbi:MAG: DegV family protein [bacterium]